MFVSNGGVWDKSAREFIFKGDFDADWFSPIALNVPYVKMPWHTGKNPKKRLATQPSALFCYPFIRRWHRYPLYTETFQEPDILEEFCGKSRKILLFYGSYVRLYGRKNKNLFVFSLS
jgi:hypothetical protein